MNPTILFEIITSAPILFFLLGVLARFVRSDLDIPHPLPKLFSIYVLVAIGIRGGVELSKIPFHLYYIGILGLAIFGSFFLACVGYYIFKRLTSHENAVALAASYGSVSAITFITASSVLNRLNIPYGPYMVAALALMEVPAILVAVYFHKRKQGSGGERFAQILHHSIVNQSVFLLLGGFVIGFLLSAQAWQKVAIFYDGVFYGFLTLFLLDLGLVAARRFEAVLRAPPKLFIMALLFPFGSAIFAFFLAWLFGLSEGDGLLLMILFGSSSYIAAPAAMRTAVPDANPGLYLSLAMGVTFPFNIIIGIPLYLAIISTLGAS